MNIVVSNLQAAIFLGRVKTLGAVNFSRGLGTGLGEPRPAKS
jgi:hypothetical protein